MSADAEPAGDDGFDYRPDPAMPGWWTWDIRDPALYNAMFGPLRVRREDERRVRLRMLSPGRGHINLVGVLHGGLLAGLADVSLFATCHTLGLFRVGRSSTIDLSIQYLEPGLTGAPVDVVGELLRETGRLAFLRGLIVQGEGDARRIAAFAGTVRKPPRER